MSVIVTAHSDNSKPILGFWIYLMTDCVLFATLFATYAVLRNGTAGGPDAAELFSLPFVFVETVLLLLSSYTSGLAMLGAHQKNIRMVLVWLGVTLALGTGFLAMELYEFSTLFAEGNSWQRSGFLSAFFTLVGTHGLHITVGLIWLVFLLYYISRRGLTGVSVKRLSLFSLFWHFLDIIWIFIFTMVYLFGVIQ